MCWLQSVHLLFFIKPIELMLVITQVYKLNFLILTHEYKKLFLTTLKPWHSLSSHGSFNGNSKFQHASWRKWKNEKNNIFSKKSKIYSKKRKIFFKKSKIFFKKSKIFFKKSKIFFKKSKIFFKKNKIFFKKLNYFQKYVFSFFKLRWNEENKFWILSFLAKAIEY